jgi:cytochrome c2
MPDWNDLPGSWLATLVALTAVGIGTSQAQLPLPAAVAPIGADLFKQQCATCHSLNAADPPRQGPALAGVYGRKPGNLADFHSACSTSLASAFTDRGGGRNITSLRPSRVRANWP